MKTYKNVLCFNPILKPQAFPPIGIELIAGAIKDLVQNISIIDLSKEKDYRKFIRDDIDLYLVSVNWKWYFDSVCDIIRSLPENVMTIVGGRYATEKVNELFLLCPNINVIVRGEGEETIREFLKQGTPDNVDGLSFRKNGKIIHNKDRIYSGISNDILPYRKIRRYKYSYENKCVYFKYPLDCIYSSRGCPANCKFCFLGQRRKWFGRSPESVIRELKEIDTKVVGFTDENFFADIKRVEKICDLIIKEKIKKIFAAQARISIGFYPQLIKKIKLAGFRFLTIGIESAQDKTLKLWDKGITIEQIRKAFKVLSNSGIIILGYFIVGNIGETEAEMLEISKFAKEIGVDILSCSYLRYEENPGLKEVLQKNKDYYVAEDNRIYSVKYEKKEITKIFHRIIIDFWKIRQILRLTYKLLMIGIPMSNFVFHFILGVPITIIKLIKRKRESRKKDLC
ncbi:MAG: radical SAM protein [Elusimicrobia bacterium]|nr:radical SAM protein [Elusimicrobiota bacterium]